MTAKLRRRQLHKASTLAAAQALLVAAKSLPPGRLRTFIGKKARRTEACGAMQHHRLVTPKGEASYVMSSNSRACHNRHCISCEARKANALARDTMELLDYCWEIKPDARALMLTLTSRNRPLDETPAMVMAHQKALKAFFAYDRIVKATLGQFGNIEVTFSEKRGQFLAHVHSHHIILVDPEALSDHRYIRQVEYVALWQRALKANYKPILDIRAIKGRDGLSTDPGSVKSAVREVCKYCLDTQGFIHHDNGIMRVNPQVAVAFALAVHRRRLTSLDRIFAQAKKLRAKARKAQAKAHSQNSGE
jgi:plasmid rolling circle replication initiator protein Rep